MCLSKKKTIAIVGGGASGVFASIRCAEVAKKNNIDVIFVSLKQQQIF